MEHLAMVCTQVLVLNSTNVGGDKRVFILDMHALY